MAARGALPVVLAAATGYLLGSLSPAYVLGRLLKAIDVRREGSRNAGVSNTYHLLGPLPAALTASIDLGKGIAAVVLAQTLLGLSGWWLAVPAWAAVLGHIFPFYLRLQGGKGMATATGIYLFFCARAVMERRFAPEQLLAVLAVAAVVLFASRSPNLTGLVGFFFLSVVTVIETGFGAAGLLMLSLSLYCFALGIRSAIRGRVFVLDPGVEIKWWRIIARPFALLFIPIDLRFGRTALLWLLAVLGVVFIAMDLVRLLTRYQLRQLFKRKEVKRFSSMTSFLVAIFITFLVFPDVIPYLALAFITIGDLFSKIIGIRFGRRVLFRERTLEGSLGFLAGCFMSGWVLYSLLPVPFYTLAAGSVFATGVELFSMDLDDNFTVGIISSGFLFALRYFLSL